MNYILVDTITPLVSYFATEGEANTEALSTINNMLSQGLLAEDINNKILVSKVLMIAKPVGDSVRLLRPNIQVRPSIPTGDMKTKGVN